jgi:hypothetical protein
MGVMFVGFRMSFFLVLRCFKQVKLSVNLGYLDRSKFFGIAGFSAGAAVRFLPDIPTSSQVWECNWLMLV